MTRTTLALLTVCACLGHATAIHAEVALSERGPGGETASLYVLGAIIDETDPIGSVWRRYHLADSHLVLNAEGFVNGDGPPSLLIHPQSGLPAVAWSRNSADGYDVVISHFADGDWSEPFVLAASSADELDPALTVDPADGSVHVIYWVHDTAPRIMRRSTPADLSAWSPADQVSPSGQVAVRPSATFHDGLLNIAYEIHEFGYGSTPRQIVLTTLEPTGYSTEVVSLVSLPGETGPSWPQVHTRRGRLWLDWIDLDGEMAWSRQQPGGGWGPVQLEIYADFEDLEYYVRGRIKALALD